MAEIALSGEEGCREWGAITPRIDVSEKLISRQTSGYFSTLDLTQIFE